MNLKNKTVLITGAAKRIGRVTALAFAEKGARVLVHYHRSAKEARQLSRLLTQKGVENFLYRADLSKLSEIRKMAQKILKETGGVDVLVNNASVFFPTPFEKTSEKDWIALMDVNFKAPFFLSQALAPAMKKKGGRIVNVADVLGKNPAKQHLVYSLSKAGLIALTKALAKALAPRILVTAVCPELILPPPGKPRTGKWGKPEDVAKLVISLAESDFMTGSVHFVGDGEI